MIVGLGIDNVEIDRIKRALSRFGERFTARILCPAEIARQPKTNQAAHLASRFAAKEAAVKALGTGFTQGISPTHIEVAKDVRGKPTIVFHNEAHKAMERLGATKIHLSLSHSRDQACAVVVLES